jgi:hypothetical protein
MSWIKCSERLPEKSGEFLVFMRCRKIEVACFSVECKFWGTSFFQTAGVTHWVPLPDGPKEEEK